jgi:hypothetical protein
LCGDISGHIDAHQTEIACQKIALAIQALKFLLATHVDSEMKCLVSPSVDEKCIDDATRSKLSVKK